MLTTLTITSRDQGQLWSKPAGEDEYYTRFSSAVAPSKFAAAGASWPVPQLRHWLSRFVPHMPRTRQGH